MNCVTKQSLNRDLKNLIIAENWEELGIKSKLNTSSTKPITYSDKVEIFIPYDAINPNKDILFGKVKNLESQLNKKYKSDKYGSIISIQQPKNGMVITISATNKIVDALNEQYEKQTNIPDNTFYQLSQDNTSPFEKMTYEQQQAFEKTIRDLSARISDRIGIPYKIINRKDQIFKGRIEIKNDYGFDTNIHTIINLAYATLDTPIHEILGHPIIRAIKNIDDNTPIDKSKRFSDEYFEYFRELQKDGKTVKQAEELANKKFDIKPNTLYQKLLKELEYGRGKEVLDRVKKNYEFKNHDYSIVEQNIYGDTIYSVLSETKGTFGNFKTKEEAQNEFNKLQNNKYTLEQQEEEAIVELMSLMTAEKLDAVKDGKLISLLKRLLKEIKSFVKQLLGQKEVEIDKLPDNMTLGDLADLLAYSNSKLILPGYTVEYTTPDNMKFKTYQEASNHISQLAKSVEDVDLSNIKLEGNQQVPEYDKKRLNPFKKFIEKNKEYEQSKEIIEEWKKVNNIQYNPEEIYSRGQEFVSVVGAYSSFDVNLMMQNLLSHIEDNEKAGGKFAISAFTKPIDRTIGHLEGGGGKIKFKIYPQSKDILWAADRDVYSGSVWDASEKVNKDKKSELLGVSYTKYPALENKNSVQPNLASIVEGLSHNHNELGITLTSNNFRLEYDEDIPYTTKKIIDNINSILDQKYGKLVKPKINKHYWIGKAGTDIGSPVMYNNKKYEIINKYDSDIYKLYDIIDSNGKIVEGLKVHQFKELDFIDIQPTQTKDNLKESIESISEKEDFIKKKEYTEQALVNVKIAKLKEVAKKYPRSLIRNEVKLQTKTDYNNVRNNLFDENEILFQKIQEDDFNFSAREQQNSKKPLTDNFIEYKHYKQSLLNKVRNELKSLYKDSRNPKKDLKKIKSNIDRLVIIETNLKNDIDSLDKNEPVLMFHAILEEIQELSNSLDNLTNFDNFKDRLDFLYKFIKGISIDNKEESNIENLKNFNHPDFEKISTSVDNLNLKYREKITELRDNIISSDISYVNNILDNKKITPEQLKNMFNSPKDINWMEQQFLGIGQSSTKESIIPQILQSKLFENEAIEDSIAIDLKTRLKNLASKIGKDFEFIFEKTEKGTKTGNIISTISPKFNKILYKYLSIDKDEKKSKEQKYVEKIEWLTQNTEIIDFRKIKSIKKLFENIYKEHFTSTEEEMDKYETYLKNILGPLYESEISKVINNLENFQATKESILQTENKYKLRNIAKIDPWAFIKHYNSINKKEAMPFNTDNGVDSVFSDIKNIKFIPIKNIFVTVDEFGDEIFKDSGYYNKEFTEILENEDKLEYWKLMNEIYSEYVSSTYGDDYTSKLSYAKFEEDWIETIVSSKGLLKGSALLNQAKKGFKSFFFENSQETNKIQKEVTKKYRDISKLEVKELAKILKHKDINELQNIAKKNNLNIENLDKDQLIYELSHLLINNNYSTNINKVTSALIDMVALQRAREKTLPIANILLDAHKMASREIRDGDTIVQQERKKSIRKLEYWVEKVIMGKNEQYSNKAEFLTKNIVKDTLFGNLLDSISKIPFIKNYINKNKFVLFSESEKEMLKHLEDLSQKGHNKKINDVFKIDNIEYSITQTDSNPIYIKSSDKKSFIISQEEYEENFQKYIKNKISELGLDLNAAGITQGILKMIIFKRLGLNPISGIKNRIEGKNSGLIMDQTGEYWTKGNMHIANRDLMFTNFINMLPERLTTGDYKKIENLKKIRLLVENMNFLQNRKNELDRNSDISKFDFEKIFNLYAMSVENPEFHNQVAIFLSIAQDIPITDIDNNQHFFYSKEKGLNDVYSIIDNKLILNEKFRTPENIKNFENFEVDENNLKNNKYLLLKNKTRKVIARSQGNYEIFDTIMAQQNIWGRAATMFKRWMGEHYMQRLGSGKNFDIFTGEQIPKGRFQYVFENNPALMSSVLTSLFIAFGITPVTGLVGLGLTGLVIGKYFYEKFNNKEITREANNLLEYVAFTKSILISTLNYPMELINRTKLLKQEFGDKVVPGYSKTNLSQDEISNLEAAAKEIAIALTWLSILLLAKKLTWDDDDDKDSKKRMLHNTLDNQINSLISTGTNWTNPLALYKDASRIAFIQYLEDVQKLLKAIIDTDEEKISKDFLDIIPLPTLLYKNPILNEFEFENKQWEDKFIKNLNSDGEWGSKKKYEEIKKIRKEKLKEQYKSQGMSGDKLDKAVEKAMQLEFPKRKNDEPYSSILSKIKANE